MPCSRARQQLIGGLNDSDLTAINVRERGWINVCVVSLRSSIHRLNTRLQCPVCSLFSFHADTWTADASDKKSLYSSASISFSSVALSFWPCWNMLHEGWLNFSNVSLSVSLFPLDVSLLLLPYSLALLSLFFFLGLCCLLSVEIHYYLAAAWKSLSCLWGRLYHDLSRSDFTKMSTDMQTP